MTVRLEIDFSAAGDAAGDLRGFRQELEQSVQAQHDSTRASEEQEDATQSLRGAITPATAAIAAFAAAAVGGAMALRSLAEASIEGRRDFVRLDNALEGVEAGFDSTDESLQQFFGSLQATTRFAGGQAAAAMAQITNRTAAYGLAQEELIAITQLSADVAEQQGRSLDASSELVIRALEGNTRAMRELGITAEDPQEAFEELERRFGGARHSIDDLEQAAIRLSNAKDDLTRFVGDLVRENQFLIDSFTNAAIVVEALSDVFNGQNEETAHMRAQLAQLVPSVDSSATSIETLGRVVGGAVQGFTVAINTFRVFQMVSLGARTVQLSLAAAVGRLALVIGEGLIAVVESAISAFTDFARAAAGIADVVPGMGAVRDGFDRIADATAGMTDRATRARETVRGLGEDLQRYAVDSARDAGERIAQLARDMQESSQAAADFSDSFQKFLADFEPSDVEDLGAALRANFAGMLDEEEELAEGVEEILDDAAKEAERKAEERRRQHEALMRTINRAEEQAARVRIGFLTEEQNQQRILNEARAALGFESFEQEIDFVEEAAQLRRAIMAATTESEVEEYRRRLDVLQEFAQAQEEIFEAQELSEIERAERQREREEQRRAEMQANLERMAGAARQASAAVGGAVANIFAGADTGEEFSRLVRQQIGNMIVGFGDAAIAEGIIMSIPGPSFSPFGPAKIAAGVAAVGVGTALGASASSSGGSASAGASAGSPGPPPGMGMEGTGQQGGGTQNIYNFGAGADPISNAREIERSQQRGRRAGVGSGNGARRDGANRRGAA